jgi:hypothetical protein
VALLLLLLALPAVVQAQLTFTTNNGAITITGYSGTPVVVTIPDTISGLPVTRIGVDGFEAFGWCSSLTSVTMGTNVTSIGDFAFYVCTSLTSVTMGINVTSIGDSAFGWCSSLTSVTIPDSVTSIGDYAFCGCPLTSVTIGTSVTSIGDVAFGYCTNLTAITVDTRNSAYSDVDGVLFNQSLTTLVEYPGGIAGTYTIPNSVTTIRDGAFYGCSSLASVTIPDSVTSIGVAAFQDCIRLTSVTIGTNVTTIGDSAFSDCSSLTSVTIPDSVTSIGDYAFYACGNLTSVTIGTSVTSIGHQAFLFCTNLTSVYFQGDAPSFGADVFDYEEHWQPGVPVVWDPVTIYYLPGTTGWDAANAWRPTMLWTPQVETSDASFGVRTNQFGFTINWASGMTVVVEACTDPGNPVWLPLSTNTLTGGTSHFSDPQWTNYPGRFYRLRSP